eukprot:2735564-Prymnesium_polylepis.1
MIHLQLHAARKQARAPSRPRVALSAPAHPPSHEPLGIIARQHQPAHLLVLLQRDEQRPPAALGVLERPVAVGRLDELEELAEDDRLRARRQRAHLDGDEL